MLDEVSKWAKGLPNRDLVNKVLTLRSLYGLRHNRQKIVG